VLRRADRPARCDQRGLARGDGANLRRASAARVVAVRVLRRRKKLAAALKPIYNAASVTEAQAAFAEFKAMWGATQRGVIATWERAWEEFIPFLNFPVESRKVIYTTNQIESINFQLRKVTKNRGHFPNDDAAIKLLYLALRNINPERGGDLGTGTYGWKKALNASALHFPGRLPI
jgi:putative transposase